ncbi:MAG: slipin family protein [Oscillospiraceae bacterium]|nr:slipin family protein [Oscillospiraceae bacterium]
MKTVIKENERGLLFKNGKYVKMLSAGKYFFLSDVQIELQSLDRMVASKNASLEILLDDPAILASVEVIDVADCKLALHFVDGRFRQVLSQGKYAFWSVYAKHTFRIVDITTPEVSEDVPGYLFSKIPEAYFVKYEVAGFQKGRLSFNRNFVRVLEPGTYYFWKNDVKVEVSLVDTRLTKMEISGQEILSQDKVALRINFVCTYRVVDCVRIDSEIDDYREQLHVAAQLALREYVGKYRIDEILENKEEMSRYVFERLKMNENSLFIQIASAGVKDIILPGEIRDIMNTVLVAEKRAQANVITRREEVASTRSLLNTAKLMDENRTLLKLKELEYVERICENVGSINLGGNGDVLTQLTSILRGKDN